jgi:hypothetical protein
LFGPSINRTTKEGEGPQVNPFSSGMRYMYDACTRPDFGADLPLTAYVYHPWPASV